MSEELRKNYEIFKLDHETYHYLILRRFCHSIQQQNQAIEDELNALEYKGYVLFDNLFKGGNTKVRYGYQFFDRTFTGPLLQEDISLNDPIRVMVSQYLKDNDLVIGTSLRDEDIRKIMNGETI